MKRRAHLAVIASIALISSPALAAAPLALFDMDEEVSLSKADGVTLD